MFGGVPMNKQLKAVLKHFRKDNEGTYYIKPNVQLRSSGGSKQIIINNLNTDINY